MKYNFNKEHKRMTEKDDGFLSIKYKMTFKDLIKFELKSLIGRFFLKFRNFDDVSKQYLNIGCGFNKIDNFLNLDFYNKSIILKKKWIQKFSMILDFHYHSQVAGLKGYFLSTL